MEKSTVLSSGDNLCATGSNKGLVSSPPSPRQNVNEGGSCSKQMNVGVVENNLNQLNASVMDCLDQLYNVMDSSRWECLVNYVAQKGRPKDTEQKERIVLQKEKVEESETRSNGGGGQVKLVVTEDQPPNSASSFPASNVPLQPHPPVIDEQIPSEEVPPIKNELITGTFSGNEIPGEISLCKICARPFRTRICAVRHARTHQTSEELQGNSISHKKCPYCQKIFFRTQGFIDHVNSHEGKKGHTCPTCKKCFYQKTNMTRHSFIHLSREEKAKVRKSWRYGCYFCQKRYRSHFEFQRHVHIHTREMPFFRCDQCNKKYRRESNLNVHKAFHANPTRFFCKRCSKFFSSKYGLNVHDKVAHPNKLVGMPILYPAIPNTNNGSKIRDKRIRKFMKMPILCKMQTNLCITALPGLQTNFHLAKRSGKM